MMNDRELLELAAKAAGIERAIVYDACLEAGFPTAYAKTAKRTYWSPLTDDGDALRLAVTLGMRLTLPKYKGFGTTAVHQRDGVAGCTAFRDDPFQQTREAIVRAAAEIGKAMP